MNEIRESTNTKVLFKQNNSLEIMTQGTSKKVAARVIQWLREAKQHLSEGRQKEARHLLKQAARTGDIEAIYQLMEFHLKNNDDDKVFTLAKNLNDYISSLLLDRIASLYIEQRDLRKSLYYLSEAAKKQNELCKKLFEKAKTKKNSIFNHSQIETGKETIKEGRKLLWKIKRLNEKTKELNNEKINSNEQRDKEKKEANSSEDDIEQTSENLDSNEIKKAKFSKLLMKAQMLINNGFLLEFTGRYGRETKNPNKIHDKHYWTSLAISFFNRSLNNYNQLNQLKEELNKPENVELHFNMGIIEEDFLKKERYLLISFESGYLPAANELLRLYDLHKKHEKIERLLNILFSTKQLGPVVDLANYYDETKEFKKSITIYQRLVELSKEQISLLALSTDTKTLDFWNNVNEKLTKNLKESIENYKKSKNKNEKTNESISKKSTPLTQKDSMIDLEETVKIDLEKRAEEGDLSAMETLYHHYQSIKNNDKQREYKDLISYYHYECAMDLPDTIKNIDQKIEHLKIAKEYSENDSEYLLHIEQLIMNSENQKMKFKIEKRKIKEFKNKSRKEKIAEDINKKNSYTGISDLAKKYHESNDLSPLDRLFSLEYLIDQSNKISDKKNLKKLISEIENLIIQISEIEINKAIIKIEFKEDLFHFYNSLAAVYLSRKNVKELKKLLTIIEKLNNKNTDYYLFIPTINKIKHKINILEKEKLDPVSKGDLFLQEHNYLEALNCYYQLNEENNKLLKAKIGYCSLNLYNTGEDFILYSISENNKITDVNKKCYETSFYAALYYYKKKKFDDVFLESEKFKKIVDSKKNTKNSKEKEKIEFFSKKLTQLVIDVSFKMDQPTKFESQLQSLLQEKDPYLMAMFGRYCYHLKSENKNFEKVKKFITNNIPIQEYGLNLINMAVEQEESAAFLISANIKQDEGKRMESRFPSFAKKCYLKAIECALKALNTNPVDSLNLLKRIYKDSPKLFSHSDEELLHLIQDEVFFEQIMLELTAFKKSEKNSEKIESSLEFIKQNKSLYKSTKDLEIFTLYAKILFDKEEFLKAKDYFVYVKEKSFKQNASNLYLISLEHLGYLYFFYDKNTTAALTCYEEIINASGELASFKNRFLTHAYYQFASINFHLDKINKKTIESFQEVAKSKNYLQSASYFYLGCCLEKLGKSEDEIKKHLQLSISSYDEDLLKTKCLKEIEIENLKSIYKSALEKLKTYNESKILKLRQLKDETIDKKSLEEAYNECVKVNKGIIDNEIYVEKFLKGAIQACLVYLKQDPYKIEVFGFLAFYYKKLNRPEDQLKALNNIKTIMQKRIDQGERDLKEKLEEILKEINNTKLSNIKN